MWDALARRATWDALERTPSAAARCAPPGAGRWRPGERSVSPELLHASVLRSSGDTLRPGVNGQHGAWRSVVRVWVVRRREEVCPVYHETRTWFAELVEANGDRLGWLWTR